MRRHALNDVEKPMVSGELNQFDAIGGSHFIENAREVRFDRVLADGRLLRNPLVAVPRHNGFDDFDLPLRQAECFAAAPCRFEFSQTCFGPLRCQLACLPVVAAPSCPPQTTAKHRDPRPAAGAP